jgi:uncharacterized membrane protein YgcG
LKLIRHHKTSSGEVMLASVALALFLLAVPAVAQTRVSTIQETIERWSPGTHVYVIGDVGVEPAALSELESWLAGGHWTVLLVQDASGQTFQDTEGVTRLGEEAIEYGTGQGMARAAGFAAQAHPKTGEPDGEILSIVLAQRALYYTGSKAQDDRGLGEAAFAGNLDRWAIDALRNGGGIAEAVRSTITNIDGLLMAEIERAPREARVAIESAELALTSLDQAAAALRAAPSHPVGSLAHPDTRLLLEDLDRARAKVGTDPAAARELALDVLRRVGSLQEPIRLYPLAAERFDEGWRQFRELHKRELAITAGKPLESARLSLVEGQALYRNADPVYAARLDRALQVLSEARQEIEAAERREAAESLAHALLSLLALCAAAATVWGLNRRRRGVKEEAEALLASWQTALDRKLEALFGELEQRVSRLVGSVSGDDRRGYEGETEALAEAVRADVGSLTILWTSARAVLEQAREHIRPRRAAAVLANFLLPGHYRKGIALLRDEPVPFDPAEGLPRLFGGDERGWREDLLGDLASYEPFRKSFEELMAEFQVRAERATRALDELEAALTRLPSLLESIRNGLWQAAFQKTSLEEAGSVDGLFLVPALFAEALPAAEAALEEARQTIGGGDPVKAHRESAARAERIASDACALVSLVQNVRSAVLPAVARSEEELVQAGFATRWIPEERRSLSIRAADLASRAAREDASSSAIQELGADAADFQERAARAVELTARLPEVRAGIEAVARRVEAARQEMGSALALAPASLLREADQDPSERLAGADGQADAARTALDFGDVAVVTSTLEQAERLTSEAAALVDTALETFRSRESAVEKLHAETERLAALVPEHETLVARLQEAFAPSALTLESGGTVVDSFGQARDGIEAARLDLDSASSAIREGRILTASTLLRQVGAHQEQAGLRLAEVAAKHARLDSLRAANRGLLDQLADRFSCSATELDATAWITAETRAAYRQAEGWMQEARSWIEAGREDPIQAEAKLLAAGAGLDRVETELVPADRRRYEEALARAAERRRQEEQERRDRERRAAERARSTLTSSSSGGSSRGSSFGSGGSGGSGSSSGSGRSSWGGGGSGSGKSGW